MEKQKNVEKYMMQKHQNKKWHPRKISTKLVNITNTQRTFTCTHKPNKELKKDRNELNNKINKKRYRYNYLIDEGTKEVGMMEFGKNDAQKCHKKHKKKKHNVHDTKVGMIER